MCVTVAGGYGPAAAMALVAAGCGGDDGGGGGGGAEGAQGREAEVDPSLCPVDALEQADGPVEVEFWHAMTASNEETLTEMVREHLRTKGEYWTDEEEAAVEETAKKVLRRKSTIDLTKDSE